MTAKKVQHWFRPVYGIKPDGNVVALSLTSDGKLEGIEEIIDAAGGAIEEEATGGSTTSVQDTKKNWEVDMWKGSIIDITVAGNRYFRKVTSNTADTLNFAGAFSEAVSEGDAYKVIPWSDVVEVSNLQHDDETLQTIVDAVEALQSAENETLFDAIQSIDDVQQGISRILDFINYYGNFSTEMEVTNGATGTGNIELTLTPDDPEEGEVPQGELFEIGVTDGDSETVVAEAIATAVNASDDYNAEVAPDGPFLFIEHVNKWDFEVAFENNNNGVTISHNTVERTIMSELNQIKFNTEPQGVVVEQKDQTDADVNDIITFSEPISAVEIYHDEATPQLFTINGIPIQIAGGGWRSRIGGEPSEEVEIPTGVDCIITRLV